MVRYLRVKGLNKRLDGEFEFNEDLNIFTGPNGSGKTTLLKLLWYLISGNLYRIFPEIPFKSVVIETDPFSLNINRVAPNMVELNGRISGEKVSEIVNVEGVGKRFDGFNAQISHAMKSSLFFPTFRRIEGGFSITPEAEVSDVRVLSVSEMLQASMLRFSDEVSINGHKFMASISTEDLGELLTQKYADIYEEISTRQAQVLEDISKEIQNKPDKDKVSGIPQDPSAVLSAIQKVNAEREQLSKPFSVLSELSRKILRYDTIHVTGQVVRGEATAGITLGEGSDGITVGKTKDAISSDKLSSGEKQMLSFLCYNAWNQGMAVFIDEPELSLHVDWQRLLFPTLLKQGQKNQFFVATHSPFIYSKYPDKEFMLDDYRGGV